MLFIDRCFSLLIFLFATKSNINCDYSIAVGGEFGSLMLYNSSKLLVKTISAHSSIITRVKALTQNRLATASYDNKVKIWSTSLSLIKTFSSHTTDVSCLAQIDDNTIVSGSVGSNYVSGYFYIWYLNNSTQQYIATTYGVYSLEYLPNGKLVIGDTNGYIRFYSGSTLVQSVAVSSGSLINDVIKIDSKYLATACYDSKIKIYDYTTYSLKSTLTGHASSVNTLKLFSSKYLLSVSSDGTVRAWDITKYTWYKTYESIADYISFDCVEVVSSDVIVIGDSIKYIRYYNMTNGNEIASNLLSQNANSMASF